MSRWWILLCGCTLIVGDPDPRDFIGGGSDGMITPCADVQSDPRNCGACGRDCTSLPGVDPQAVHCLAGQCDLRGACLPGRADCSGGYIDGCESDLSAANHCGNCTAVCGGVTPLCTRTSGGLYTCSGSCTGGTTECGLSCVDLSSDPQHCGACTNSCPATGGQQPVCVSGLCSSQCAGGFHNCSGVCVDSSSLNSCGARCAPCPAAPTSSVEVCDSINGCDFVCNPGFTKGFGACTPNSSMPDLTPLQDMSLPLDGGGLTCILLTCATDQDCINLGCNSCGTFLAGSCF